MQTVVLEHTNLRVSRLSFGTSRLHHLRWRRDRRALLEAAFDAGFTHFDTSPYYGFALAEHELGHVEAIRSGRATVATKVGMYNAQSAARTGTAAWSKKALGRAFRPWGRAVVDWSMRRAKSSLASSLRRLRRDHIDLLLLHEPDPDLIETDEYLRWFEDEQRQGRVRHWGCAGNREQFADWMDGHSLRGVLQVRDSLASPITEAQITFGYLTAQRNLPSAGVQSVLADALARQQGSVLVSTRRRDRLAELADAGR